MRHHEQRQPGIISLPLSLKSRLLLIITAVLLLAAAASGILTIHNARESIRAEFASTSDLVRELIRDELGVLPNIANRDVIRHIYTILQGVRHIDVRLTGDRDNPAGERSNLVSEVPPWFSTLVYPRNISPELLTIKGAKPQGNLIIHLDPADEIRELWREIMPFTLTMGISLIALLGLIYLVIHTSLNPLQELLAGFERVEKGEYDVRVNENVVTELSQINRRFNQITDVLKKTKEANRQLSRKLVDLQEDERKFIAHELHDEMSPYLFQIRVDTMTVANTIGDDDKAGLRKILDSINNTTAQLQDRVRKTLEQLRPVVLNDLGLREALMDLVRMWQAQHPAISLKATIDNLDRCNDDTLKVSVYRIVQECLTNIIKHAGANTAWISVSIAQQANDPGVRIIVEDNGKGLREDEKMGLGLAGMRERADALGGWLTLEPRTGGGLRIESHLPFLPGSK